MPLVVERQDLSRPRMLRHLRELEGALLTLYLARDAPEMVAQAGAHAPWLEEALHLAGGWPLGRAVFLFPDRLEVVLPPFQLELVALRPGPEAGHLIEVLERRRRLGVILLRLGGYSVGLFDGQDLVGSKTDRRLVHGRHRAGGSSANRFRRRREKEIEALYTKACRVVASRLGPHLQDLDHIVLGGEKITLNGFLKACEPLRRAEAKILPRRLDPAGARRVDLEAMPRQLWSSRLVRVRPQ